MITLLDQTTINKIAAGEVVERPSAVVKELVENAIDAGANGITIEIKEGGISFIRITDNGIGIDPSQISLAFKRHSTSKIKSVEDLMTVKSLGFRGEALASIAAVSQVELVTKTAGALTGSRFVIEGGEEKSLEEIGCPEGTTFLIRNLFYNTPARRKFLKSATTEAGYISDLVEKIAISHPGISFKFIHNNQVKLQTSGTNHIKDIIYHVYGRDISSQVVAVSEEEPFLKLNGFIGKPVVSRGNRNYMNYFINGRYIKSSIINRAIEEAYKPYTMSHRYPFAVLSFEMDSSLIDVNVHPTKMEVRFSNQEAVFRLTYHAISEALKEKELIPKVTFDEPKQAQRLKTTTENGPEPFEINRIQHEKKKAEIPNIIVEAPKILEMPQLSDERKILEPTKVEETQKVDKTVCKEEVVYQTGQQMDLFLDGANEEKSSFLTKENIKEHRIIGQLFSTYWLVEFQDKLFLIDQHAAHEKVLFERTMNSLKTRDFSSQIVNPPIVLTLNLREEEVLRKNISLFKQLGFEIEPFGGKEYSIRAVPFNLFSIAQKELLIEMLDDLVSEDGKQHSDLLLEKIASLSCKAAVKGNMRLSELEAHNLIDELMTLENPYHCPHGRPTIVSMTKHEIEKKFKRII